MIQSLTIPVDSGTYTFPNSNVLLTNIAGLGTPDPKRGDHEYANAPGGILLYQSYQTRRIVIDGFIVAPDIATYASVRRTLEHAYSFFGSEKTLQLVTDDNLQVQTNVIIASKFDTPLTAGQITGCPFHVELDAHNTLFISQTGSSVVGGVATVTGGVVLPATLPFTLTGTLTGAFTVTNGGNPPIFPDKVILTGPGNSFILSNRTTGFDLLYNGTLSAGDQVVIDFERQTAIFNPSTDNVNVYGNISGIYWQLVKGSNTITLACGGGNTSATQAEIDWHNSWLSL